MLRALVDEIPTQVGKNDQRFHGILSRRANSQARGLAAGARQRSRVALIESSFAVTVCVGCDIPEAALVPARGFLPVGAINSRVNAYSEQRYAATSGFHNFGGDVAEPWPTPLPNVTRLRNEQRTLIARMYFDEELVKRHPPRISQMPVEAPIRAEFPLLLW